MAPDGTPVLGVVADLWRGETFTAIRGRGAHLNGTPIQAGAHTTLTGHLFLTEWAAHTHWPGLDPLLSALSHRHCTTRVMGSTALSLSLSQVAAGRATAAAIGEFHAVDGLPAYLIATEAGAVALPRFPVYDKPLLLAAPGVAVPPMARLEGVSGQFDVSGCPL
ncbi:inositol monophosphatase family protein [Streptomyces sp. NPDC020192]|uniref:inositol monophosphatase family protein n=1 Tax=Streptomyces sp. NPDC020192 TaxID=3365066 RepID=UPI0037A71539